MKPETDIFGARIGLRKGPSSRDLLYAAGFFDGEGCIVLHIKREKDGYWHTVFCTNVSNINRGVLEWLRCTFGGNIYADNIKQKKLGKRTCWSWRLVGTGAERLLRYLLPYLRVKRRQAEIALIYRQTVNSRSRTRISNELLALRKDLAVQLRTEKWRSDGGKYRYSR